MSNTIFLVDVYLDYLQLIYRFKPCYISLFIHNEDVKYKNICLKMRHILY